MLLLLVLLGQTLDRWSERGVRMEWLVGIQTEAAIRLQEVFRLQCKEKRGGYLFLLSEK